jgi:beta-1,4-mannosyl-glycoprotein beta-1,4-N-acetylglucosaminyltransferase
VFDAFMFGTELDLLELRLRELWGVVDHFVLVEANVTHTLRPKPFVYEQHKV